MGASSELFTECFDGGGKPQSFAEESPLLSRAIYSVSIIASIGLVIMLLL